MSSNPRRAGSYVDGIWFCGCGMQAKWLTSKREISKGRRFLRCPNSLTEDDCGFFIWEDEERARRNTSSDEDRRSRTLSIPPTPQTPHTSSSYRNQLTPPSTSHGPGSGMRRDRRDSSSPTPNRKDDASLAGNSQLTKDVLNLLQSSDVWLKVSTREKLRRLINSEVRKHETELQSYQESVSTLGDQLDKLEIKGHV